VFSHAITEPKKIFVFLWYPVKENKEKERHGALKSHFVQYYTTGNNVPSPNPDIFWQIVTVMKSF
jgi:hypothetical protein